MEEAGLAYQQPDDSEPGSDVDNELDEDDDLDTEFEAICEREFEAMEHYIHFCIPPNSLLLSRW